MGDRCAIRLIRELKQLEESDRLAMTVSYKEDNIREIKALLVGPPGTPYGLGFYRFAIKVPSDYPGKSPKVTITTTNRGQTRFGPNLYASGKVCLSILGTWDGERGEQWSPAQGLESVLLSIQSLLSANPYINEPGFESEGTEDNEETELYKAKILHENLRLAVIEPVEEALRYVTPESGWNVWTAKPNNKGGSDTEDNGESDLDPFHDYCKKRFLWYLDLYKRVAEEGVNNTAIKVHQVFPSMPFEHPGNEMKGTFNYPHLQERLNTLEGKIMNETRAWADRGLELAEKDAPIAVTLRGQHEQIKSELARRNGSMVDLDLVDRNPFLWRMTYFGSPATPFDGGAIAIKIYISPRFPAEQPRVFVETPIFHIRVSPQKVLMYLPSYAEDMGRHVDGIISALEEETPPFNPLMTVNAEASRLCWGTKDERKQYARKLRRSIEATVEL